MLINWGQIVHSFNSHSFNSHRIHWMCGTGDVDNQYCGTEYFTLSYIVRSHQNFNEYYLSRSLHRQQGCCHCCTSFCKWDSAEGERQVGRAGTWHTAGCAPRFGTTGWTSPLRAPGRATAAWSAVVSPLTLPGLILSCETSDLTTN